MLGSCILGTCFQDTVIVGTIEFNCPFNRTTLANNEAARSIPMPVAGTLDNLFVTHQNEQAVSEQTITVKLNTNNTALAVNIPIATAGTTSDTSNSVAVAQGDLLSISFDSPSGSTAAFIVSVCLRFTPSG